MDSENTALNAINKFNDTVDAVIKAVDVPVVRVSSIFLLTAACIGQRRQIKVLNKAALTLSRSMIADFTDRGVNFKF